MFVSPRLMLTHLGKVSVVMYLGEWTFRYRIVLTSALEFDIGLAEGSENSDGVTFHYLCPRDEIFRRTLQSTKWEHIRLGFDTLSRNQRVKLRFTTAIRVRNRNTGWDWARWGEP